ncbi:helix-turn-helix domain-containing protein [Atopobium fossor]|uniref:helix-turn-helix domain-containing protein n=1 Tax=Atopobium fossor TaxID=39487 RepID=UPI00040E0957|nr:LexA family transcriptional regulator [Atopobium fossor]
MHFGNNVKRLRELLNLTHEEFGQAIGYSQSAISAWESKRTYPRINTLEQIACVYDIPACTLLDEHALDNASVVDGYIQLAHKRQAYQVPLVDNLYAHSILEDTHTSTLYSIAPELAKLYPDSFFIEVPDDSLDLLLPIHALALIVPMRAMTKNNDLYLVAVDDEPAILRRVRKLNNGYELSCESTDATYRPRVFDYSIGCTQQITILGKLAWYMMPYDWKF